MTFNFILFTITIKKREYSGQELEKLVKQQKYEQERQDNLSRIDKWK
ncbi:YrzI family small protein [Alkalihalobacillus sp. MEB130]|nr:YrzI family small protein [Alkalihalobacillus sp. MEB130]MDT8861997.1 YrzI family small protein [Alkalihalobacillus sp. MEB130]